MKRIVVSGAVLALAIAGVQAATAAPATEKVTGGGQITNSLDANGAPTQDIASGPGNTIAFNAQEDAAGNVKGQVQFVDRSAGKGKAQRVLHGVITCVNVISPGNGGTAKIGGHFENDPTKTFVIDVTDAGEGAGVTDMIMVREGAASDGGDDDSDGSCNDSDDFAASLNLGRGNVQIHG